MVINTFLAASSCKTFPDNRGLTTHLLARPTRPAWHELFLYCQPDPKDPAGSSQLGKSPVVMKQRCVYKQNDLAISIDSQSSFHH